MDHFHHLHLHPYTNPYLPVTPPPLPPPQAQELVDTQQQQQQQHQQQRDRERLPQWSQLETAEFLSIRAELDNSFLNTKRNKALWEAIAARLRDKGFSRTPDQCKSKWKNLVTRFKGCEAMEQEAGKQQFPFYEEMRRIFAGRMERARTSDEKRKGKEVQVKEWDDDEDDEEAGEEEETTKIEERGTSISRQKKRKVGFAYKKENNVEVLLTEFMRRQMEMEERWMEAMEAREAERRAKEEEWRKAMVALGEERLALVSTWREREEERSARAEARAERRHQLITALLAKLEEHL